MRKMKNITTHAKASQKSRYYMHTYSLQYLTQENNKVVNQEYPITPSLSKGYSLLRMNGGMILVHYIYSLMALFSTRSLSGPIQNPKWEQRAST